MPDFEAAARGRVPVQLVLRQSSVQEMESANALIRDMGIRRKGEELKGQRVQSNHLIPPSQQCNSFSPLVHPTDSRTFLEHAAINPSISYTSNI